MKKLFYLCLIVTFGFAISSCSNKAPKNEETEEQDPYYSSEMSRTAADTTAIALEPIACEAAPPNTEAVIIKEVINDKPLFMKISFL